MWRTMQVEPGTGVPYRAHDAVKVLNKCARFFSLITVYGLLHAVHGSNAVSDSKDGELRGSRPLHIGQYFHFM